MGGYAVRSIAVVVFIGIVLSAVSSSILRQKQEAVSELDSELARSRHQKNCNGTVHSIHLRESDEFIIDTSGYNGQFMEGCQESWEVKLFRDKRELKQLRIKVEILEMNMPCSTSSIRVEEDSAKLTSVQFCNDKEERVFSSHGHIIALNFKNKDECKETGGCFGVGAKLKISAEYVCGGKFTEDNGYITSPFYPLPYPPSTSCIYDISGPLDGQVALTCAQFALSPACSSKRCKPQAGDKDFLQDIIMFKRYEESELAGITLVSKKFHHTLYFLSNDHLISEEEGSFGFNCTYKFI